MNSKPRNVFVRFSLRHLLIGVTVLVLFFVAAKYSIQTHNSLFKPLEEASAIWLAHDMLALYMAQGSGEWPESWDDLQPMFRSVNSRAYGVPDVDWLRERVTIDFDFDPKVLASSEAQDRPLHVLRMSDGRDHGEIRIANERLKSSIIAVVAQERLSR